MSETMSICRVVMERSHFVLRCLCADSGGPSVRVQTLVLSCFPRLATMRQLTRIGMAFRGHDAGIPPGRVRDMAFTESLRSACRGGNRGLLPACPRADPSRHRVHGAHAHLLDAAAVPLGVFPGLLALNLVLEAAPQDLPWLPVMQHGSTLLLILSVTWAAVCAVPRPLAMPSYT